MTWISRDERRETSTCDVVSRLSRARTRGFDLRIARARDDDANDNDDDDDATSIRFDSIRDLI